jgi:hypothetical protein
LLKENKFFKKFFNLFNHCFSNLLLGVEKEELDNYESSNRLLKNIKLSLTEQINSFFQDNKENNY